MQRLCVLRDDDGVGLVEILVAMLLFAIIMIGFVPVFVASLSSTARSAAITSASRVANQQLESARSAPGATCEAFVASLASASTTASDGRGPLTVTHHLPSCVKGDTTVVYRVTVEQRGKTLADVETEIWLHG